MLLFIAIGVVFIVLVAIGALFATNYIKAEPNEAVVLTGRKHKVSVDDGAGGQKTVTVGFRTIVGAATLRWPVIEKVNKISLKNINLRDVRVTRAYSKEGVPINIDAIANVKISSKKELLSRAIERFLGVQVKDIATVIRETLEGQLREIIGTMTVEELNQEREKFTEQVREQAGQELAKMGVIIDGINIQDIKDEQEYLESLGRKKTAEVKRDAEVGEAEARSEAMQKSETAVREGLVVKADQEKMVAEAEKIRDVAKQEYSGETAKASETASQEGPKARAIAEQTVVVEQQKVDSERHKARAEAEKQKAFAEEQKYKADVVIPAEAEKEAAIAAATAIAEAIRLEKEAEAKGIEAIALAEAKGLEKKAEAYEKYGKAAALDMQLETTKVVAKFSAEAVKAMHIGEVVVIGGGGNGSDALEDTILATGSAALKFMKGLKAATGIDLTEADILKGLKGLKDENIIDASEETLVSEKKDSDTPEGQ